MQTCFFPLYRVYLILEKCRLYKLASKRNILMGQINEDMCSDNEIVIYFFVVLWRITSNDIICLAVKNNILYSGKG
jgi:hypothetical protein